MLTKLTLAARHPQVALLRLAARIEEKAVARLKRHLDDDHERQRSIRFLSEEYDCDASEYLEEYRRSMLFAELVERSRSLNLRESSSPMDCETLYLTVRAAKPTVVVETGVLHGAMTWHALEALDLNGGGMVHSIDLPRPSDDAGPPLGVLIPERLRGAWHLHLGNSLTLLPDLLRELGEIHLFNHDSVHTVEHMLLEYALAHASLVRGGTLCSHDVVHSEHYPNAFPLFARSFEYRWMCCRNFGIARKVGPT